MENKENNTILVNHGMNFDDLLKIAEEEDCLIVELQIKEKILEEILEIMARNIKNKTYSAALH